MHQKYLPSVLYISPWVTLLLGIVTLGMYSYVWASRRLEEAVPDVGKMSHWTVPIGVIVSFIVIGVIVMIVSPLYIESASTAATVSVYGNYGLLVAAQILVTWWMVYYVLRLVDALKVKRALLPVVLMAFFFSPVLMWYLQRQFNEDKVKEGPLVRAVVIIIAVTLGISAYTLAYMLYPIREEIDSLEIEYQTTREYIACHEELMAGYPDDELSEADYEAYLDGYEECEELANF